MFAVIDDTITANGVGAAEVSGTESEALRSARVGGKGVVSSVVAFLGSVSSTISAFPLSSGRASITVDKVAIIALLSSIDNAVRKSGKNARSSTRSSRNISVLGTEVAFLIKVLDAITAVRQEAVGSANVGESIIVEASRIALLTEGGFNDTVSASDLAISAAWDSSVSVLDAIQSSEVALLFHASVENAITAFGKGAVGSASTIGVGVLGSVVALLDGSSGEKTSTAAGLAVGEAGRGGSVLGSSKVAKFVPGQVNNTVTAFGKGTVGSARIGGESVGGSVITLFTVVDDTITAFGGCARGSASVGDNV